MQVEGIVSDILDSMRKTSKARFSAHRRLNSHNIKSLMIVIFYSTVLLLTSIAEVLDFKVDQAVFSVNTFKLIQISLALVILIFSSIITYANYAVRAEKFHQCGLEINGLIRTHELNLSSGKSNINLVNLKYNEILKRYDNHSYIDYVNSKKGLSLDKIHHNLKDNATYLILMALLISYTLKSLTNLV
ncbi:hypothetical protein A1OQ_09175 [Enterovibrio norvegicus FF-162]|uniref:SLATT domain-containing protein n=1 Tax=Enterovibrio norvegicus TaxID=188144 RepID=UPI00035D7389|nr:hypothetical protein A1OQ_09175 [Enterovibrio norvegicus FF-162]